MKLRAADCGHLHPANSVGFSIRFPAIKLVPLKSERGGPRKHHCSQDKVNWTSCGSVFPDGMPEWIQQRVPGVVGLWAPDISYFNGQYHLYYHGSKLHTQETVIGLATNTTLDPTDPDYKWVDRG